MVLTYNLSPMSRFPLFFLFLMFSSACTPSAVPAAEVLVPDMGTTADEIAAGFLTADGSRPLVFPEDFGAHEEFRTEWWYYTGNLQTPVRRHFGFELTVFRVSLLPPSVSLPDDSEWYGRSVYFAHFAVSDVTNDRFYAFERYARPGPGLAGADAAPYHVWIEDWSIQESATQVYHLQAAQGDIALDLMLTDEMGVVLHGENGYSRKGEQAAHASYYYSQPRLRAEGKIQIDEDQYLVSGLVWKDHEFSTSALDENQIGWDWFSLQFEDGSALMLFQLRERDGKTSASSSGTFIRADGTAQSLQKTEFEITVEDEWRSPHTRGVYPAAWKLQLDKPHCELNVRPWMADQEIHFATVTYWEGAVQFDGSCDGAPVTGNGYVELTGYAGNLPLP
ncbi:MAG TPA: lipocalin-like domain-containing protein [Anaerolineales bacterium]|jgi:predicted secreted hydrolase|nr:lipocalin-like domain-containing protein [Anaerolineales bacterium]